MIAAQDTLLMAEHLSAHEAQITKIDRILQECRDRDLAAALRVQREVLARHVQAMNALLENRAPAIPAQHGPGLPSFLPLGVDFAAAGYDGRLGSGEQSILIDALTTARYLSEVNFRSALHKANPEAQRVHFGMALDQARIAVGLGHLAERHRAMRQAPFHPGLRDETVRDYGRPAAAASRREDW